MNISDVQTAAIKDFLFLLSEYDDVNVTIEVLLKHICEYYEADRVCAFEQDEDGKHSICTFEWCKDGLPSVKENQRNTQKKTFKFWDERFKSEIGIHIEVNEDLKHSNAAIYEILSKSMVQRLIAAPLLHKGDVEGVLAVENPRKNMDHLMLLSIAAGAIFRDIQHSRSLAKEKIMKKQLDDDVGAIGGLASEYNLLLVINLKTLEYEAFVEGKRSSKAFMTFSDEEKPHFFEGFVDAMNYLCHPDDLERMLKFADYQYLAECLKNKKRFTTRFRGLNQDKVYVWVDLVMIKFDPIDQPPTKISFGYVNAEDAVAAENARQKELKDALEKAEKANNAKTEFLSNMSHDIRTPMNAILGFARLMEKQINNPTVVADYLKKILYSSEYLLTIINNILDLASIDSGKIHLDEGFMDVFGASNSMDAIIEGELKRKKITIIPTANIQHRYVFADSSRLRQIMVNLLSNAVKYTRECGHIHLDFSEIPSEREGYATYITTVSDDGIGMSKEFQEKIFDSFSRERNTTESGISGTGLGMAIVKRLVDLMDGKIEMESELGKGTTFRITNTHKIVDAPETYLKKNKDQVEGKIDFTGRRILLAEDNELNAEIAQNLLEDMGLEVDRVADGVACVDALSTKETNYYDLILMDVQMPNMDGYTATGVIRNMDNRLKANIPIIAMTANAFEEDKQKAFESGMDGHLAKPIDVEQLVQCLTEGFKKPHCLV